MELINKALSLCEEIESRQAELRSILERLSSAGSPAGADENLQGRGDEDSENAGSPASDSESGLDHFQRQSTCETGAASAQIVAQPVKSRPDIRKAFTINDRFRFRRELFAGDDSAFDAVLDKLSTLDTLAEADEYLASMPWEQDSEVISEFMTIVAHYFNGVK